MSVHSRSPSIDDPPAPIPVSPGKLARKPTRMAKLGGFDDLSSNAQSFLTDYRAPLETMSEAESATVAVREVYSAYYSQMAGVGAPPEPKACTATTEGKVERFQS